jgi:hypothetical protein
MINEIDAEIRKDINKKAGCADLEKAANNIIKLAKKKSPGARHLHGAWIDKNGSQYVCDGHHAIKIFNPISLEVVSVENTLNIDQLFDVSDLPERFELPGVAELKSMIKEAKQAAKLAGRKSYSIAIALKNGPVFNADYLLNTIMATDAKYIETQKANPIVIMWLIILPLLAYFIPEYYLKFKARERVNIIKSEIPTFRTFALSMLETKTYPVYDILQILVGSTTYLKEDLIACTNEYFVDSKLAIKHLHDKIDDKEFHIVCNGLLQAIDEDKDTTLVFLHQQLLQYDTLARLKEQEKIKKKPNLFVVVLGMPLVSILVIWFYPWFLDAMSVLGGL